MYRFLRQPRWIFLLILVPLLVVTFFLLSEWQKERYDGRNDANATIEQSLAKPAAPLEVVLGESHTQQSAAQWRQVTVTGTYLADRQVLVRKKPMQGKVGFWVVTPLRLDNNYAGDENVVLINRGWVPPDTNVNTVFEAPAPPAGEVTITGRLQNMQSAEELPDDLPAGQVLHVNPDEIALPRGSKVAPMYVNLQTSNPSQTGDITVMPEPEIDSGPHLSYALQWIAFAIVLVVGIFFLIRREAKTLESEEPQSQNSG